MLKVRVTVTTFSGKTLVAIIQQCTTGRRDSDRLSCDTLSRGFESSGLWSDVLQTTVTV